MIKRFLPYSRQYIDKADIEEYHGSREIEEIHGILFLEKKSVDL